MTPRLLSTAQVAEALSAKLGKTYHVETIRRWARKGCPHVLNVHGHRMFKLSDVLAWYLPSKQAS